METEEAENNEILWRAYSDEELIAIENAIIAALSPEEKANSGKWMLPSLDPSERTVFLNNMRSVLPPQAFTGLVRSLQPRLSEASWRKLTNALGPLEFAA